MHSSSEPKKEQDEGSSSPSLHFGEEFEDDGLEYLVTLEEYGDDPPVKATFKCVGPTARHKYEFSDLEVNSMVMANYNIENPKVRAYWYDVCIPAINKTKQKRLLVTYVGREVLLENCRIISCDDVFKIEKPTPVSTSTIEVVETAGVCQNAPSCSRCSDNPHVKCKECSCYVCGGKAGSH